MLVFIDESGDPGFKLDKGSSRFFVVSLIVFEDREEALVCDRRIKLLRKELKYPENFEFHFKDNSHKVRAVFLRAVAPYNFFYYGIVINKDPQKLWGNGFKNKESFYKYACGLVFENAKEKLEDATVVIDRSGRKEFRSQLAKYLRKRSGKGTHRYIKKVKLQESRGNNLIQLADYVAGVIYRSVLGKKKFSQEYRKQISHREIYVQIWPR